MFVLQEAYERDYLNATRTVIDKFAKNEWQLGMIYYEGLYVD